MRSVIQVMQVLRVPPMGKLVVDVGKQRYESWDDITDENVHRLLLAAIGELVNFAGGYDNLVNAGVAPPITTGASAAARPPERPQPGLEEQQAAFLASLEAERDTLREAAPTKRASIIGGGRSKPTAASAPSREPTVVEQIDAILQKHIAADPSLAQRSIHLEQNPSGGLRIQVDGTYYQKPAEITETKIQILIKRALEEWENL